MRHRTIEIADRVLSDLRMWGITKREFRAILEEMKRVAALQYPLADAAVWKLNDTDWMRVKLTEPAQIRVFFSVEQDNSVIVIECVIRRVNNTYKIAKIIHDAKAA